MNITTEAVEVEEVELEEVPQPQVIETGDSIKVKQVLDDAVMAAIVADDFEANYGWDNFKLFLMFLSCVFAMVAQFYPQPFPDSRLLLAICCAMYFIISTALQCIVVFVDKDIIMYINPKKGVLDHEMVVRTNFPRFQEFFYIALQGRDPNSPCTTAKMYVGKYFTSKGEFDEVRNKFMLCIKRLSMSVNRMDSLLMCRDM